MVSAIAGVLLGPWCWAALLALALAAFTAIWVPLAIVAVLRERRRDREWAAGAAERVRTAGILARMEEDLGDLEVLAGFLDERGRS